MHKNAKRDYTKRRLDVIIYSVHFRFHSYARRVAQVQL